ncbi:hypothetical protein CEXT_616281 [Caerostris extrusa]|uniref:Uncharacterized protein n=1 Tax=Caerostris extrusa TaxID=172846 RepID=A0AAV4NSX4_CAEEX|nr:hypothetical protein CEXT_616281 [Caerostris extrusa]
MMQKKNFTLQAGSRGLWAKPVLRVTFGAVPCPLFEKVADHGRCPGRPTRNILEDLKAPCNLKVMRGTDLAALVGEEAVQELSESWVGFVSVCKAIV